MEVVFVQKARIALTTISSIVYRDYRRAVLRVMVALSVLLFSITTLAGTFSVFGPQHYKRAEGEPQVVTTPFTAQNPGNTYTLKVYNGGLVGSGASGSAISAAVITLNGVAIFSPNDFNQHVSVLTKQVTLTTTNTLVVELRSKQDGVIAVEVIGTDDVPPVITASVSPAANAADWNNTDVVVTFTCQDALSGIAQCPAPKTVSAEGADQKITGTATDKAGNNALAEVTLNIDKTPPTITASKSPEANSDGWHSADVTVTFSCSDATSGVVQCPATQTQTQEIAQNPVTASVQDKAGNTASIETTVSVDKTPPVIDVSSPAEGSVVQELKPRIDLVLSDNLAVKADSLQVTVNGADVSVACAKTSTSASCVPTADLSVGAVKVIAKIADMAGHEATTERNFVIDGDDDSDGVRNTLDQCPATPSAETVDTQGCSPSQKDADGDGVPNNLDLCPDTLAGAAVDANGCDPTQKDTDGDGVPDLSDAYPDDPTRWKLPIVTIDTPKTLTTLGHTPVEVSGQVDSSAVALTVNGVPVDFTNGHYNVQVDLEQGHNTVVARMVDAAGVISTASVSVSLDMTPPYITVESHTNGQTVYSQSVAISGLVNDIVRGTIENEQAQVTVNGVAATVANRSYLAENIPLSVGENTITIEAADQVGNTEQKTFKLIYQPVDGKHLEIVSGQNQTAQIDTKLAQPLKVKVLDGDDQPVVGKQVVFRVIEDSGVVGVGEALEGRAVVELTDSDGIASTYFKTGVRAGAGNQVVRAKVVGYEDEAIFYATATTAKGDKLSVNSGNNQRGGIFQPLPAPFVAVVTDEGANFVKSARVQFVAKEGGGLFENGKQTIIAATDSDGRASAHLTLGSTTGLDKQIVEATLLDGIEGQTITAGFTASGFVPGNPGNTTITGIVTDNQDNPLVGATIRVDGTTRQAVVDAEGHFKIEQAPVGPVHLIADGTSTTVDGEYPTLSYNIVTVSGVENPLPAPIYMVKLDTENAKYAGKEDVVITLPDVPGFKLEIPKDSVTFPDGSREGYVSVTAVNSNKMPMLPPNGMQPQFIITIQPTGAMFEPPARLTLPNVDGYAPGRQIEMFSYDHDLEEFVAIGLGTVSEDGATITSNPGVGVVKAGWHCGAPAGGNGCCKGGVGCGVCRRFSGVCESGCAPDDSNLPPDADVKCEKCKNGDVVPTVEDCCKAKQPTWPIGKMGNSFCCNKKPVACTNPSMTKWSDAQSTLNLYHATSEAIFDACVKMHEDEHTRQQPRCATDERIDCGVSKSGMTEEEAPMNECVASRVEAQCLNTLIGSCPDDWCRFLVNEMIKGVKDYGNTGGGHGQVQCF